MGNKEIRISVKACETEGKVLLTISTISPEMIVVLFESEVSPVYIHAHVKYHVNQMV